MVVEGRSVSDCHVARKHPVTCDRTSFCGKRYAPSEVTSVLQQVVRSRLPESASRREPVLKRRTASMARTFPSAARASSTPTSLRKSSPWPRGQPQLSFGSVGILCATNASSRVPRRARSRAPSVSRVSRRKRIRSSLKQRRRGIWRWKGGREELKVNSPLAHMCPRFYQDSLCHLYFAWPRFLLNHVSRAKMDPLQWGRRPQC
ncbi:hypothetical protein K438DRAFT_96597 [Mycena galopus ATCC 62051]|nr:hypothetical protein K438DRAFT_96597 [Mycena galopus ATCC 62051]